MADKQKYLDYDGLGKYNEKVAPIDSPEFTGAISMGRKEGSTVGGNSVAVGTNVVASGDNSIAIGENTTSCGVCSFSVGSGRYSATDDNDDFSTLTPEEIIPYFYQTQDPGLSLTSGDYSFNEGYENMSLGAYSHAEGKRSVAFGDCSHAEASSKAIGQYAHSEGRTVAIGEGSHSEGDGSSILPVTKALSITKEELIALWKESRAYNIAYGYCSHSEGDNCLALANAHAEGHNNIALGYQHAQGHYNNDTTATAYTYTGTSTGTAFVIGNGTNISASNAFRITGEGVVYGGNYNSSGADYTEFEEWADGNPDAEDRVGYFVTYDENSTKKIRKANADDWILGVYSGTPCIIGNADEDWMGRYITDEFGRKIQEEFEYEVEIPETVEKEVTDEETGETRTVLETVIRKETKTGVKWKENSDYDSTKEYTQRAERPEWATIGWMGVIHVRDDGTCQPHGFCKVADGGIVTAAEPNEGSYLHPIFKVIDRTSDNVIRAVIRF